VPEQAPLHPVKVDVAAGTAVRVIVWFCTKVALQTVPQLIPAGELLTVPLPLTVVVSV
jgi:hypothetical protein